METLLALEIDINIVWGRTYTISQVLLDKCKCATKERHGEIPEKKATPKRCRANSVQQAQGGAGVVQWLGRIHPVWIIAPHGNCAR